MSPKLNEIWHKGSYCGAKQPNLARFKELIKSPYIR